MDIDFKDPGLPGRREVPLNRRSVCSDFSRKLWCKSLVEFLLVEHICGRHVANVNRHMLVKMKVRIEL